MKYIDEIADNTGGRYGTHALPCAKVSKNITSLRDATNLLRHVRAKSGLTQKDFAAAVGMPLSKVQALESGRAQRPPSSIIINKIIKYDRYLR